jgi:hypothetical protein
VMVAAKVVLLVVFGCDGDGGSGSVGVGSVKSMMVGGNGMRRAMLI